MPCKGTMKGKRANEEKKRPKEKTLACTYFSLCSIESSSESDAVLFAFHPRVFSFLQTLSKFIHFTRQPCSLLDRRLWAKHSEICKCLGYIKHVFISVSNILPALSYGESGLKLMVWDGSPPILLCPRLFAVRVLISCHKTWTNLRLTL